jgi:hypothetical protein
MQLHYCPFGPLTRHWGYMGDTAASICDVKGLNIGLKTI